MSATTTHHFKSYECNYYKIVAAAIIIIGIECSCYRYNEKAMNGGKTIKIPDISSGARAKAAITTAKTIKWSQTKLKKKII